MQNNRSECVFCKGSGEQELQRGRKIVCSACWGTGEDQDLLLKNLKNSINNDTADVRTQIEDVKQKRKPLLFALEDVWAEYFSIDRVPGSRLMPHELLLRIITGLIQGYLHEIKIEQHSRIRAEVDQVIRSERNRIIQALGENRELVWMEEEEWYAVPYDKAIKIVKGGDK